MLAKRRSMKRTVREKAQRSTYQENIVDPEAYSFVRCNLCGSDNPIEFGKLADRTKPYLHYRNVKCRKCELVYANPQASTVKITEYYSVVYPESTGSDYVERLEKLALCRTKFFQKLDERGIRPGRFLEIGCATGHFLDTARKFGWEVYGVELSETFAQYARQQFGLEHIFCVCSVIVVSSRMNCLITYLCGMFQNTSRTQLSL